MISWIFNSFSLIQVGITFHNAEEDVQEVNAEEASVQDVEAVVAEVSATIITEEEINNPTADLAADNDEVEEKDSTTLEFACVVCGSEFKNKPRCYSVQLENFSIFKLFPEIFARFFGEI